MDINRPTRATILEKQFMAKEPNKTDYWLVTADNQLGAIHWNNPLREEDYYNSFQTICKNAAEDPACLGVLALGDVRERASIQAKNLEGMNAGLKTLLTAQKPMLAIMGNHDYTVPNWIEGMHYPCLHNLTDKKVQARFGFDPDTTLALDFKTKGELEKEILENCEPTKVKIAFFHQSIRELTTNLRQSYDISLDRLEELGLGAENPCLVLLGDLHNYGDAKSQSGNLHAAYPGSPEMTDINEGSNGLKSDVISSNPHDYRKFVIHYYPNTQQWKPVEIACRPWFRAKAKTQKESTRMLQQLKLAATEWKIPGCIALSCPKNDMADVHRALRDIPILEARVEEYNEETEKEDDWRENEAETSLSWPENKKALVQLAVDSGMDSEALALLQEIVARDGSTPNAKNDVASAWAAWNPDDKTVILDEPDTNTQAQEIPEPNTLDSNEQTEEQTNLFTT